MTHVMFFTVLAWIFMSLFYYTIISERCDGEWIDESDTIDAYFVPAGNASWRDSMTWLRTACETEMTSHSCYWKGETEKAQRLEKRRFSPHDPITCHPFSPNDFLSLLKGRRLLFIGDSLSSQIFASLICALRVVSQPQLSMKWGMGKYISMRNSGRTDEAQLCPFGEYHCLLDKLFCGFEFENIFIARATMFQYTDDLFVKALKDFQMMEDDIVVINFGLHYGEENMYTSSLRRFRDLIESDFIIYNISRPQLFFLETTPQHFFGSRNGYFQGSTTRCAPLESNVSDWRNNLLSSELGKYLRIIRIANALYSQYDAHIEQLNISGMGYMVTNSYVDCTHYCFPSGVFRYIHREIYGALVDVIGFQRPSSHRRPKYNDGQLLRKKEDKSVYIVNNDTLHQFQNGAQFIGKGLDFSDVLATDDLAFSRDGLSIGIPVS